ncbi:MAG: hypothetical protein ACXQS3_02650 [Candidatus Methanofastidiosia archaeon]
MKKLCIILCLLLLLIPTMAAAKEHKICQYSPETDHMLLAANKEAQMVKCAGWYEVTTVLKGAEIERLLGVPELYHTERFRSMPIKIEDQIATTIEILDPKRGLKNSTGMPRWSYEAYFHPLLPFTVYVKADPINLVFEMPYSYRITSLFTRNGWRPSSPWNIFEANVNYVLYKGRMIPQKINYFRNRGYGQRYHLRVWSIGRYMVGQSHIDTRIPHKAYLFETAESKVAYVFRCYVVRRNSVWLNNICRDFRGYRCNGWATCISYK